MAETTAKRTSASSGGATTSRNVDYELHYFEGIRGGAQPIRWILIDADANWNEKLVSWDQWESKFKADESFSGLFRTLPVLQVNATNTRISQLLTIVSYLGRKLNYYGSDTSAEHVARVDSICSAAVLDVALPITRFMHLFARYPDLQFDKIYNEYSPRVENILKRLDYLIGDRNFFCGDKITTADLLVFEAFEVSLIAFGPLLAAKYPHLDKLHDRIKERPNIKAWRTSGNMPYDITMSSKYKEFLRLLRDRFTADNSSLESMGATGTKKLDELKQLGKAMKKGQGQGQAGDIKGKSFDVKDKDVGEGEALKGKKMQQQQAAGGKASGVGVPLKTGVKGGK